MELITTLKCELSVKPDVVTRFLQFVGFITPGGYIILTSSHLCPILGPPRDSVYGI